MVAFHEQLRESIELAGGVTVITLPAYDAAIASVQAKLTPAQSKDLVAASRLYTELEKILGHGPGIYNLYGFFGQYQRKMESEATAAQEMYKQLKADHEATILKLEEVSRDRDTIKHDFESTRDRNQKLAEAGFVERSLRAEIAQLKQENSRLQGEVDAAAVPLLSHKLFKEELEIVGVAWDGAIPRSMRQYAEKMAGGEVKATMERVQQAFADAGFSATKVEDNVDNIINNRSFLSDECERLNKKCSRLEGEIGARKRNEEDIFRIIKDGAGLDNDKGIINVVQRLVDSRNRWRKAYCESSAELHELEKEIERLNSRERIHLGKLHDLGSGMAGSVTFLNGVKLGPWLDDWLEKIGYDPNDWKANPYNTIKTLIGRTGGDWSLKYPELP